MSKKVFFISGFNGSNKVVEDENAIINLLHKNDITIERIDYYKYYRQADSKSLIQGVVQEIINNFYENGCEPLNIVAWSLGGSILAEALNIIESLNSMVEDPEERIEFGKIFLFSPSWYITDMISLIKNFIKPPVYATKEAKNQNKRAETSAITYILKNPNAIYHLFNISTNADNKNNYINNPNIEATSGLEVFSHYNTTCIVPQNDSYINVSLLTKRIKELDIDLKVIGDYGHMAPVNIDIVSHIYEEEAGRTLNH